MGHSAFLESTASVTHLIIPKQETSASWCQMVESPEQNVIIQSYLEEQNLIQVGWVHTHPLYNSFFRSDSEHCSSIFLKSVLNVVLCSSVDLHAQLHYQNMIPAYTGLVYSGLTGSTKAFRLTNLGLVGIAECERNPPIGEDGENMNINYPHEHKKVDESEAYEQIFNLNQHTKKTIVLDLRHR